MSVAAPVHHAPTAPWPLSLPPDLADNDIAAISTKIDALAEAAMYGWGHTIDFGPFTKRGLMGKGFLRIAGALDDWGWWPADLTGKRIADIGCFTGGLTLYLAHRGASTVYAVDELPDHLDQCAYMADVFGLGNVHTIEGSLYQLDQQIEPGSLDMIVLSGVLYHLSDMLVGLHMMRHLLKPGGVLLVETNGVNDFDHSYANFGRYYKGMWWQPSGLAVKDMCDFMGFADVDVRFYEKGRCLAKAVKNTDDVIPYKRGMNWPFESMRDANHRTEDESIMAPILAGTCGRDGSGAELAAAEKKLAAARAELAALKSSRAMRAVRGYWKARETARRGGRRIAKTVRRR